MTYVAYVHAKPDAKSSADIFYVGKGLMRRAKDTVRKRSTNRHYKHTVAKYGSENILVGVIPCSSEEIAFELERGLIKCLRRSGVKLTNLTDGGEGSSGYKPTEKALAQLGQRSKRKWEEPGFREKMSEIQTVAQKGITSEKKRRAATANAELARQILQTSKKEEAARKNSEKSKANWADDTFKQMMRVKFAEVWTEDRRLAKGDDVRGRVRMTDGVNERNVRPEEVETLVAQGWRKGRKSFKRTRKIKEK